jgi:hypothetical protein
MEMPGLLDPNIWRSRGLTPGMALQRGLIPNMNQPAATTPAAPTGADVQNRGRKLALRPKAGVAGVDVFVDLDNGGVPIDAATVTPWERANAIVGDDFGYNGANWFPMPGGGTGADGAGSMGATAPDAGTGMPGGVGPDPAAAGNPDTGGVAPGGPDNGPSPGDGGASPSSDGGHDSGEGYAKGGAVTRDRLKGKNPPGPDDGSAALDVGEHVIPADEVRAMGGQANVMKLRAAMRDRGPELMAMLNMPTMKGRR